jgi:5-methylthioadenosine/S-adenosylhomocysteine deaminase
MIGRTLIGLTLLLAIGPAHAQTIPTALTGTVLTPSGPIQHGTVLFQNGKTLAVGDKVPLPPNTHLIETHAILLPSFIDLHNHLTWNIFPRWKPNQKFGNRYDWQQTTIYDVLMDTPHGELAAEGMNCDMEWYAEVKAVSEGETSVVGGATENCGPRLARNLDLDPRLAQPTGPIIYNIFPFEMTEAELASAKTALDHNGALLIHVAEGAPNNAAAAREFDMLKGRGLLRKGVSVIHGVAFTPEDFKAMATAGTGFIWSPRSNIELYGDTANVAAAKAAGVKMALAPDWSPTGSDGTLAELNYAATWNASQYPPVFADRELVEMTTSEAAALVNLDHELGTLAPGYAADILALRPRDDRKDKDAYWSVVHSDARDVELVTIAGDTVYADPSLTAQPAMNHTEVCGAPKQVIARPATTQTFEGIEGQLRRALAEWGRKLAPLAECGQ